MVTRRELQSLAQLRLREAEVLFAAGYFDGCAYLCGYVVELALKARICATLGLDEYPEKGSRVKDAFRTHEFDDLKLLAGMEKEFSASRPVLLANWSIASKWKPERRYEPEGTYDRAAAEAILNAIRAIPGGVFECISLRW
jgi:HEPN domain-containing protein